MPIVFCFLFFSQTGIETSTVRGGLAAYLFWSCIDVIRLWLQSTGEFCLSPQWGSTVRTLVNRPMGRFAWTNHNYFQITQPGCSTVTPLYQLRRHNIAIVAALCYRQ
jgi:hypothetical protein